MSERDTLDNNTSQILHDYASPNVKLLVGRKKVEFNVQENVLSKVTHFQKCLNLGFKEASTKTIELLDDDQEGIAQLLHWVYTGPMSDIPCDKTSVNRSQAEVQRSMSLVQSYVVADNYSVEGLTNRIVDIFITYFGGHFPIPSLITTLTEAGLETCRLRQFFVHHLARAIADARSGCARWQDYIDRDTDWRLISRIWPRTTC